MFATQYALPCVDRIFTSILIILNLFYHPYIRQKSAVLSYYRSFHSVGIARSVSLQRTGLFLPFILIHALICSVADNESSVTSNRIKICTHIEINLSIVVSRFRNLCMIWESGSKSKVLTLLLFLLFVLVR